MPEYPVSSVYRLVSLLVYTFGLVAFVGLFVLWVRQRRSGNPELMGWAYPAIFLYSAAWFALNLVTLEFFILLATACAFPFLLAGFFRTRGVWGLAAAGAALAALALLIQTGKWSPANPRWILGGAFSVPMGIACLLAMRRNPGGRLNIAVLVGAAMVVPAAIFSDSDWLSLMMRSLPLSVLMVDSYTRRRFVFFDLFVKWGTYFGVSLTLAAFWFQLLPRTLHPLNAALLLLPLVWGVPRLCRELGRLLDQHVLGRRFSPGEAERMFLERLQTQAKEEELCEACKGLLEEIFVAQAAIELGSVHEGIEAASAPVTSREDVLGRIVLAPRKDGKPYFSQDLDLLKTLGEILGFLIENRRLEARRQTLFAEASRSELKALRAQINPHFLFNALNTVAGLIPSQPQFAEETVERLAEVFRYTLRRSEAEWVSLGEEIEFVRAYLDVEKARRGERLSVEISVQQEAENSLIPAMIAQTLVENALKHGVSRSLGACRVEVRAEVGSGKLRLTVIDSGPGPLEDTGSGHGLRNIRERLKGYYGGEASLRLERLEGEGLTRATVEIPA